MADVLFKQIGTTPRLANLIQHFWVGEVTNAPGRTFTHVAVAQSSAEILIHYEGEFEALLLGNTTQKAPVAAFYGPTVHHQQYASCSKKAGIFGIKLSPFAIPALFSMPASELTNQSVALADVLGCKTTAFAEKILAAKTGEEKARIASSFFEERRSKQQNKFRGIEYAVACAHRTKGRVDIKFLVHASCLSPRQFERNFKALTGFSAQTYLRIVRFEHAIHGFPGPPKSLTEFSLACGYYDQAHFNRDFKLFTGLTPHQYFAMHSPSSV
ncbi:MAG: AraC family transcriptional regulator [Cytophagales bacterium]|nr:AraC family transcriptional regulator [Cytophagales bacterium]